MNLEECKIYLKNFLDKKYKNKDLASQLEWLKTYKFTRENGVDEDSTTLAKAIYFTIWHTSKNNKYSLPLLTSWQSMDENYGGETINTFNTLFQDNLEGAKKYVKVNDEFYKEVEKFQNLYLTIGNFMLLPKGKSNGATLNTKKGSYNFRYKDYCDLFLFDLFETNNLDDLKEANKEYFENLSKEEFFKKNFLDVIYENNKPKIIFQHYNDDGKYYPYYWWQFRKTQAHSDEYKKFAQTYIEEATKIIDYRADVIKGILLRRLNG